MASVKFSRHHQQQGMVISQTTQEQTNNSSRYSAEQFRLRRSNAIRIKPATKSGQRRRGYEHYCFANCPREKRADCLLADDDDDEKPSLLDQIRLGVKLHPVGELASPIPGKAQDELNNLRAHHGRLKSAVGDEPESLLDALARVLEKRSLAMQVSDDESDLSSIDSRPEVSSEEEDEEEEERGARVEVDEPKGARSIEYNTSARGRPATFDGATRGHITSNAPSENWLELASKGIQDVGATGKLSAAHSDHLRGDCMIKRMDNLEVRL